MSPFSETLRLAGLALIGSLLLTSCGSSPSPSGKGPSGQDDAWPEGKPGRIVSLNLCADQYLLALADREQIAGLTRNAPDPAMSAAASQARGLPILKGSAEEVAAIEPDLVLGASKRRSDMLAGLPRGSYRTIELPTARSFADIVVHVRQVARAVGHPERGEALIAKMERDLAAIHMANVDRVAAYYQRRGFLTGTGTLVDDLMRRSGVTNLAEKLDKPILAQLSLEELIEARPDYLIVESDSDEVVDQGTEMLNHPLLKDIPRIRLPQAWTVCGGPAYVDAARSLSRQLAEAEKARLNAH